MTKDLRNALGGSLSRRDAVRRTAVAGAGIAVAGSLKVAGAEDATPMASASASPVAAPAAYAPKGPKVEKLTLWTRSSPDSSPNEFKALKAATEAYTAAIGTPVELVTVPDADFRSKLSVAAPEGNGPDVFGPIAHDWLGELATQKITMPLDDIVGLEDVSQGTQDAVTFNGKKYGMPSFSESLVLFRNKDIIADAPTTWDELVSKAKEATKDGTYGFGFEVVQQYFEGAFFHAMGGYIFKNNDGTLDYKDIGLNNEGSIEAAKWLRDMFNKKEPEMPEDVIDQANASSALDGLEEGGQLGMRINGPWREPALKDAKINYEISKLPTAPNGKPLQPFSGIQAFCANAFGKQADASKDLVYYLGSVEGVKAMYAGYGKAPVHESMRDEAVKTVPSLAVVMDQVKDAVPMPNIPQMAQVWQPWGDAMVSIVRDNQPDDKVKALLDDAVKKIQDAIAKNG